MKRVFTTLFLFLSCAALNAQNPFEQLVLPSCTPEQDSVDAKRFRSRKDSIRKHRPVVALVLAGGGAFMSFGMDFYLVVVDNLLYLVARG